jgi:type IV pilus assembly protein PilE
MEQYYQDRRDYGASGGTCGVVIGNSRYFNFSCANTGQTYALTATGTGSTTGFVYTLNQNSIQGSTVSAAWGGTTHSCWITRKGEAC